MLFRSERGIGRGEVAESHLEAPLFAGFMLVCGVLLFAFHLLVGNLSLTVAVAVSMLVFGITVVRVEYGVFILVLAMLLSPEIEAGNEVTGERPLSLRYDDILIIVIFLGVMVKMAWAGQLTLWRPSPVNHGIAAYYTICCLSTFLAYQRNLGAWDERDALFVMLKMLEFYLIFFLVGHAIRGPAMLRKQVVLFFIVAMIVSVYGIYTIGSEPRVSAPFETGGTEPNTLGGYLTLVMCVSLALYTQAPTLRLRIILLSTTVLAFVPMLYTLSRASYLALLAGFFTVGFMSRRYILLGTLTVLVLLGALLAPEKVVERVKYTFQEDGAQVTLAGRELGTVDKSTYERIHVWRKVRYMLGIGGLITWFGGGVSWETVLDSQYARVILETGLLGLAAFVFLQVQMLRTARQAYRWCDDWFGRGLGLAMFAATLALIVHSVGTISFLIVRIMEPFWFLLALANVARNHAIAVHTAKVRAQRLAGPSKASISAPSRTRSASI